MARKGQAQKREIPPDSKYGSVLVQRLINKIMLNGKKTVAERIVYEALKDAGTKLKKPPMEVFQKAMDNISPMVQLRSRRVGGSNYQIPTEVSASRKIILSMQWLIGSSRSKKGMPMAKRLSLELVDAYNNTGGAIKKKEDTHKMAEANRAFAHFARF
ncbi:MAG: 30S ribosomal protein S7 [Patescibacteria group bacterium]|nr:30S ribosomal protein S7 [Patescibacteria group bacterium]